MRSFSIAVLAVLALGACTPRAGTTLQISAQAQISAAPNMATMETGVFTQAKTAAAAMAANAARMNGVIDALKKAGVAEKDVQTSQVSLNPQFVYAKDGKPSITGYEAQNRVLVTVRDLKHIGDAIDALVASGANQVNGIAFGIEDLDGVTDKARAAALKKARARAEAYAAAAGLRVARVVSISENGDALPPIPLYDEAPRAQAAAPTPVSPGQIKSSVVVNVVYELR